ALMVRPGIAKAAALGERDTREIALADLAVGSGLLVGLSRRPWVLARAAANVGIAAVLLRRGTRLGRAISAGLGAVTVADLQMADALRDERESGRSGRSAYGRLN